VASAQQAGKLAEKLTGPKLVKRIRRKGDKGDHHVTEAKAQNSGDAGVARAALLDLLRGRSKKARFVTELLASLRRLNVSATDLDGVLSDLETEGIVMIRDHFCADPHLANVDLRIVALVEGADGSDAAMNAIREIDEAWDKWLAEYLVNHRCG
jgi:hypothetical protein